MSTLPTAHALRVGAPFDPRRRGPLPEATHYAWDPRHEPAAHHRLVVMAARPTAAERAAFKAGGTAEFAFAVEGPVLLFFWRAEGWPWSEAPYAWQLQRTDGVPSTADIGDATGVMLDMILVDAATGLVAAMRRVALPGRFGRALHEAIVAQSQAEGWSEPAYDGALRRLMARPTSDLVARAHADHRCIVGAGSGAPPSRPT